MHPMTPHRRHTLYIRVVGIVGALMTLACLTLGNNPVATAAVGSSTIYEKERERQQREQEQQRQTSNREKEPNVDNLSDNDVARYIDNARDNSDASSTYTHSGPNGPSGRLATIVVPQDTNTLTPCVSYVSSREFTHPLFKFTHLDARASETLNKGLTFKPSVFDNNSCMDISGPMKAGQRIPITILSSYDDTLSPTYIAALINYSPDALYINKNFEGNIVVVPPKTPTKKMCYKDTEVLEADITPVPFLNEKPNTAQSSLELVDGCFVEKNTSQQQVYRKFYVNKVLVKKSQPLGLTGVLNRETSLSPDFTNDKSVATVSDYLNMKNAFISVLTGPLILILILSAPLVVIVALSSLFSYLKERRNKKTRTDYNNTTYETYNTLQQTPKPEPEPKLEPEPGPIHPVFGIPTRDITYNLINEHHSRLSEKIMTMHTFVGDTPEATFILTAPAMLDATFPTTQKFYQEYDALTEQLNEHKPTKKLLKKSQQVPEDLIDQAARTITAWDEAVEFATTKIRTNLAGYNYQRAENLLNLALHPSTVAEGEQALNKLIAMLGSIAYEVSTPGTRSHSRRQNVNPDSVRTHKQTLSTHLQRAIDARQTRLAIEK